MFRALIDTNVIISSLFWKGSPRKVIDAAIHFQFEALTSLFILQELEHVLLRVPFSVPPIRMQQILRDVLSYTTLIYERKLEKNIKIRDPYDQRILAAALGCDAQFLITGDKDLLSLKTTQALTILTPTDFCLRLLS